MDLQVYINLIDICAVGMLLLSLFAMASSRMRRLNQIFMLHSLLLTILIFIVSQYTGNSHILIICALTLILKVIVIPKFMSYTMDKIKTEKEVEPIIGIPGSLLISLALIIVAYLVTEPMVASLPTLGGSCFAISLSIVFIGLLLMITRRKALTESIGLLLMENGLFLGALTISYGMPLIVELGIFFDVGIAIVVIGVFAYRINKTFDSIDISFMRGLKD